MVNKMAQKFCFYNLPFFNKKFPRFLRFLKIAKNQNKNIFCYKVIIRITNKGIWAKNTHEKRAFFYFLQNIDFHVYNNPLFRVRSRGLRRPVVITSAFQAMDPGSIPGMRTYFCWTSQNWYMFRSYFSPTRTHFVRGIFGLFYYLYCQLGN